MIEHDIFSKEDFEKLSLRILARMDYLKSQGHKFKKLKIAIKEWRKSKTPKQHATYWYCIGQLKEAFRVRGENTNEDELHYMVKKYSGFTRMITLPDGSKFMVVKSIKDLSPDATVTALNNLIEFVLQFAAEKLEYVIDINGDSLNF